MGIHICHQCPTPCAFRSEAKLRRHEASAHPNSRTESNLDLCRKHLHGGAPLNHEDKWEEGLAFVHHNFAPTPAAFRAGLRDKVPEATLREFDRVFVGLMQAQDTACKTFDGHDGPTWDCKSHVFSWLLFHVEMLVFAPKRGLEGDGITKEVNRRLDLFRCGHIRLLWHEAMAVQSRAPGSCPPLRDDDGTDRSIQDAADKDNTCTAYA